MSAMSRSYCVVFSSAAAAAALETVCTSYPSRRNQSAVASRNVCSSSAMRIRPFEDVMASYLCDFQADENSKKRMSRMQAWCDKDHLAAADDFLAGLRASSRTMAPVGLS